MDLLMQNFRTQTATRLAIASVALVIMLALLPIQSAAQTADPNITPTSGPTPTASPTWEPSPDGGIGPANFPADVNPLTGLQVDDPVVLQRRPLAVKISNAPVSVRPQAGIGEADLVFEHLTEGQLTRFTAVFWTHTPPRVGSIRSARLIDLEVAKMYGAIFAFSGASNGVRDKIFASDFADRAFEGVTTGAPLFYRDDSVEVPHNMFGNPEAMWDRASEKGVNTAPKLGGMVFSKVPQHELLTNGQLGKLIKVDYGPTDAEWRYDANKGFYWRWSQGQVHTDANTNRQISAENVVLLYAWHQLDYNIVESEYQGNKSYSIELQLWTLGPVLVCRDGLCLKGRWNRWDKADMLTFWTEDGQPIYLKPGNTWFEVVNLPDADPESRMTQQITVQ
jgi:hypothetical protein